MTRKILKMPLAGFALFQNENASGGNGSAMEKKKMHHTDNIFPEKIAPTEAGAGNHSCRSGSDLR